MKCLDSDILVAILRGDKDASALVDSLDEEGGAATTVVNVYEIMFGARKSFQAEENVAEAKKLLAKFEILPMDVDCADKAGEIHSYLSGQGKQIDVRDIFIGSIALCHSCKLITRNEKDFSRIKGLQIEKW